MATVALTRTKTSRARLARCFHALADPNRLRLLEVLAGGEQCVCDLQGIVGAGQSLLSFHLKTLKEAGLVIDRRAGRWAYYAITPDGFKALSDFMRSVCGGAAAKECLPTPSGGDHERPN